MSFFLYVVIPVVIVLLFIFLSIKSRKGEIGKDLAEVVATISLSEKNISLLKLSEIHRLKDLIQVLEPNYFNEPKTIELFKLEALEKLDRVETYLTVKRKAQNSSY